MNTESRDARRHQLSGLTPGGSCRVRPAITPPKRIHSELAFYEADELAELHRSVTHELEQRAYAAAKGNR